MIPAKQSYREVQYRPQAAKTLRQALIRFITREFPRLGGPWVIELPVLARVRRQGPGIGGGPSCRGRLFEARADSVASRRRR